MTNLARLMDTPPQMPETCTLAPLTKTLIVAKAALIAVLASVFRHDFHQLFHSDKRGVGMCACLPCA
jgi:hypothetical protein